MATALIGLHAAIGELGVFAFLWLFVELLNPDVRRAARGRIAALVGTLAFFASWIVGGYYYLTYYGKNIKPVIKSGPLPWAHLVMTETKEHVFLFLPFLALLVTVLVYQNRKSLERGKRNRSILMLSFLICLIGLAMAGMGYLISSGFRAAFQ